MENRATTEEVTSYDIEVSFLAFYKELLNSKNLNQAIEKLNNTYLNKKRYWFFNAERIFEKSYNNYINNYCNLEAKQQRFHCYREAASEKGISLPHSDNELSNIIENYSQEYYEKCRRIYFMFDLYPNNEERFNNLSIFNYKGERMPELKA